MARTRSAKATSKPAPKLREFLLSQDPAWLDAHLSLGGEVAVLFGAGLLIGVGARTAGGCTSGHGLTGAALLSPASLVSISTIMATAVATTLILDAVV